MIWSFAAGTYRAFSYDGKRQMSRQIIDGVAEHVKLPETLRVMKKGGTFAIHDLFSKDKYGDMQAFVAKLKDLGYERAELIPTDNGRFMSPWEARWMLDRRKPNQGNSFALSRWRAFVTEAGEIPNRMACSVTENCRCERI